MKAVSAKMKKNLHFQIERDEAVEIRAKLERDRRDKAEKDEADRIIRVEKAQAAFKAAVAKQKVNKANDMKQHQKKLMEKQVEEMLKYELQAVKERQKREEERLERRWKDPETKLPRPELTMDQIRARHAQQKQELRQQYAEFSLYLATKMDKAEQYRNLKQGRIAKKLRRKFEASQTRVQQAAQLLESVSEDMQPKLDAVHGAARERRLSLKQAQLSALQSRAKAREQKMKKVAQSQAAEAAEAERRAEALKREADEKAQKALQLIDTAHSVDPVKTLLRSLRLAGVQDAVDRQKRQDAFRRQRQAEKLQHSMQQLEQRQAQQQQGMRRQARVAHKVMLEKHRNADKLYQLNITNNLASLKAQLREHESDDEGAE